MDTLPGDRPGRIPSDGGISVLPIEGPERVAAVERLQRLLADDFHRTGVRLSAVYDMDDDTVVHLLNTHRLWLHDLVDDAHDQAVAYARWAA